MLCRVESSAGGGADSEDVRPLKQGGLYQAIQPYTPMAQGELAMLQDDTVKVLRTGPQGWVTAFNQRSRDTGYAPGKLYSCLTFIYISIQMRVSGKPEFMK